jgi:hypothetical protein
MSLLTHPTFRQEFKAIEVPGVFLKQRNMHGDGCSSNFQQMFIQQFLKFALSLRTPCENTGITSSIIPPNIILSVTLCCYNAN